VVVVALLRVMLLTGPWVDRARREMRYRGHILRRTKCFLVDSLASIPKYSYPGFQYTSMQFYRLLSSIPAIAQFTDALNSEWTYALPGADVWQSMQMNHLIATLYTAADDCIGFHSDRADSFRVGSLIVLVSLGGLREFHVQCIATGELLTFVMKPGDMIVMGPETNRLYKHALVPVRDEVHLDTGRVLAPRMSLCFRSVTTRISAARVEAEVAKSNKRHAE
jgi:alkylated DNA repair dioxygenase AlkB